MTEKKRSIKQKYVDLKKSIQALKQFNITAGQMPVMMKEFRVWWHVTRNLKELEGSWFKAITIYSWMFKGVPRKEIQKIYDPYEEQKKNQ